ncbi:MAG: hypothetical protein IKF78_09465 [Atopobiaceae bacterium]|nr:hypothetical protein [Atopobiaceae bacterium]
MAIIRNERANRRTQEPVAEPEEEEVEIDYTWHPTEEEFSSPITAEQWAELLGDPSFAETDASKAVRCLRDYGGPATFQQMSIRYRGTMGRYRRWLSEAAQAAGERFGVPAPQKDQFGMDEWWPLLYRTRATGKPGAGVFEMELRPEVEEAFSLIEEQERQAKRAENARQLKRIEQLERARREERERSAAQVVKAESPAREVAKSEPIPTPAPAATPNTKVEPPQQAKPTRRSGLEPSSSSMRTVEEIVGLKRAVPDVHKPDAHIPSFVALNEFLDVLAQADSAGGSRFVSSSTSDEDLVPFDATGPLDYALRYADRLRGVLALMREGDSGVTAAAVARVAGDKNVEHVQDILNGQRIPDFSYLDTLKEKLYVNPAYLEAPDGRETSIPAFCTYQELLDEHGVRADLNEDTPAEIVYVVDDSHERRTGVILRFSALRCVLLSRVAVEAETKRGESEKLDAFVRMVDELDTFARDNSILRTSRQIGEADWDRLVSGQMWPGSLLR